MKNNEPLQVKVRLNKATGDIPQHVDVELFGGVCDSAAAEQVNQEASCDILNIQCEVLKASFFQTLKQRPELTSLTIGSRTIDGEPFHADGFPARLESISVGSLRHRDRIPLSDVHFRNVAFPSTLQSLGLSNTDCGDPTVQKLKDCDFLESVRVNYTKVTDESFATLGALPKIKTICVRGNPITDEALKHLQDCRTLDFIDLRGTKVTDRGVEYLEGCEALRDVALDDTAVTDACLKSLAKMKSLVRLNIVGRGNKMTQESLQKFHNREKPYE